MDHFTDSPGIAVMQRQMQGDIHVALRQICWIVTAIPHEPHYFFSKISR
jgi:hypothetical protein